MSDYVAPIPYRGQIVLWYEGGVRNEENSCPAIVKLEGHTSLHLKVFAVDNEKDITCVRHLDDPNVKEWDRIENGCWDFNFRDRKPTQKFATEGKLVGAK